LVCLGLFTICELHSSIYYRFIFSAILSNKYNLFFFLFYFIFFCSFLNCSPLRLFVYNKYFNFSCCVAAFWLVCLYYFVYLFIISHKFLLLLNFVVCFAVECICTCICIMSVYVGWCVCICVSSVIVVV